MLTMDDFADLMGQPFFGEVAYAQDIPELLEYPCNCIGCMRVYEDACNKSKDTPTDTPAIL